MGSWFDSKAAHHSCADKQRAHMPVRHTLRCGSGRLQDRNPLDVAGLKGRVEPIASRDQSLKSLIRMNYNYFARVAELVDALDLGSSSLIRSGGSSPLSCTSHSLRNDWLTPVFLSKIIKNPFVVSNEP